MAYTEEENICMLELYELSKKTPRIARELFKERFISEPPPHETTFKKRWKEAGFLLQDRGGLRHGLSPEQYRQLHKECGGYLEKMIEKTGFKRQSITSKCRVLGIEMI